MEAILLWQARSGFVDVHDFIAPRVMDVVGHFEIEPIGG